MLIPFYYFTVWISDDKIKWLLALGCGYAAMNLHPFWFLISVRSLSQVSYRQHDFNEGIAYLSIAYFDLGLPKLATSP
jgi:hypothetical protein